MLDGRVEIPRDVVLSLRSFGISYGSRPILADVGIDLPCGGVTVLLGPSGTGKSTLLRALSGGGDGHPSLRIHGGSFFRTGSERPPLVMQKARLMVASVFENLVNGWPMRPRMTAPEQHAHVSSWLASLGQKRLAERMQCAVVDLPLIDQRLVALLRVALLDTPMILLDEPTAGLGTDQAAPLLELMRQLGVQRSLLVAMHHLGQARALADRILLISSRRVQEFSEAHAFFDAPRSEAGRLFLRTGSCPEEPLLPGEAESAEVDTPKHEAPAAPAEDSASVRQQSLGPNGFAWLLDRRLAGTPWPGLVRSAEYELRLLQGIGVTHLVTLTDRAFDTDLAARHGMSVSHEPIKDMQPPDLAQALRLCRHLDDLLASGAVVAVHCRAGLGRTGTVLACYWIWHHCGRLDAHQALRQIRQRHPGWVQSSTQVDFLHLFARAVARRHEACAGVAHLTSTTGSRQDLT